MKRRFSKWMILMIAAVLALGACACAEGAIAPGEAERLRPDLAVGRLAASVPPRFLAVPGWGVRASDLHQLLERRLLERDTWQGKAYCSGHQSGLE